MCRALCGPSHAGQEAEVEAFAPGEEAGRPAVTKGSRPRPAGIGRLEPRLFTLDLLRSPALRHKIQTSLNKGKASNNLRKAVFFHRLGQIRDRAYENQQYRSLPFWFTPHGATAARAFASLAPSSALLYVTRQGFASQISAAYSAIVRSLENFPEFARFRITSRVQASGSA